MSVFDIWRLVLVNYQLPITHYQFPIPHSPKIAITGFLGLHLGIINNKQSSLPVAQANLFMSLMLRIVNLTAIIARLCD
ncbi:hypothetical protein NIES2107_25320 [Nostoc carneum NIES-2107]|nr:hypothetical protein NIES2107_25320 [Nostoc carneum NIES-2107]